MKAEAERVGIKRGLRFGVIVSRFNARISERLLKGALDTLKKAGVPSGNIEVVEVPGAFEIPGVAMQMGRLSCFDALICLGAVIEGETAHFQYICAEVSRGIGQVSLVCGLPAIFGVLTTATTKQAMARSSIKTNKGADAADTAIKMGLLYQKLKEDKQHG
ncbi:MAG: 6,7-dimethyl-8-ribityllumazine synthase [Nitrospirae bacterium]|nr:6,7-dimethyl-8-ribityllumazine synthase [Candidatus Troglogloeales bacterium]